jgi:hypothetical protein
MVTISFKTFDSFKKTIEDATLHPDRLKPDRYYVTNANGAIKSVAVLGMAGKVLLEYNPSSLSEIKLDDPWLKADPDNDILAAVEVADIG